MSTNSEEAMNNLRASNPKANDADVSRAMPNFARRNQVRAFRRVSIGLFALAIVAIPAASNLIGNSNADSDVLFADGAIENVKGAKGGKSGKSSGGKSTGSSQLVSFSGAPSLELGASPTELVGADQNFRSARDGFSFPNYAGQPTNDAIDATTMAALFGKEAVCADPNAALCVMAPGAQAVADQLNAAMASGRCEGMSVLAQRFYDGFESRPNGAGATSEIAQASVAKQIGYWWATQVAPPVAANSKTYRAMTPVQITNEIINGLRARTGFTLGLYSSVGGHSVNPIAVTKDGDNFNIYVYDNNYPGEIRKVVVNSATQTWTYGAAALSSGAASSTWTGSGAGTMDLTSMASRQGPFKVSLGGTKGVKGNSYSVIVTQKGNTTDPVGLKITSRFGEVNSLDPKSVSTANFPVKSFLGAGVGQGAIAYIPTVLAESDGIDLEIVGGKKNGQYTVSVMRTGAAGVAVESNAKFEMSIENSPLDTKFEVDLLNPNDSALVRLSSGNSGVDVELAKGQSVEISTSVMDDDAFRGSRRIEDSVPTFGISSWDGVEIATGKIESKLQKGEAQITNFSVNPESGEISTSVEKIVGVKVDNSFIKNVVPSAPQIIYDTVTKKPTAESIETLDPIQLPIRAIAGAPTTTSTTIATTTTVAPAAPPATTATPAPTTTLAPESIVVTLSAQRYYGDTNSSIKDSDWTMSCVDSNSSDTGCTFLTDAMKTSAMSDLMTMSLTLNQMAKVDSYSSEDDSDVLSAEMNDVDGMPSNYTAEIIVQLEVMPRPVTVMADKQSKTYGDEDPALTYTTIGLMDGDSLSGSLDRAAGEDVDTYAINQGTLDNSNYDITFNSADLTIGAKALTVTAEAKTKVYDSADPVLTYTYSGLKTGDSITGDLSRATGENVGTYAINQGTLSAGSNYTITYNGADLTITTKTVTVTADAKTKVYDSADPALTYTQVGLKTGDTLTGSLTRDSGENVGTHAIRIGTLGNANYSITFNSANLTITAKTLTVTADAKTKVYGSNDPALTYTSTGLKTGDLITGALSRATGENVGTYEINQGTLSAGSNYTISFTSANLSITVKPLAVTADAKTKVFGDADPALTYSTIGLVSGDSVTGSLTRVAGENVGTYAINQGSITAGSNYSMSFTSANLTITPKPITVVVTATSPINAGTTTQATATYVSTGTLTWTAGPANICTISASGLVTAVAAGDCTVTASVSANGNYQAGTGSTVVVIQAVKANCGGGNGSDANTPGCTDGGRNEVGVTVAVETTTDSESVTTTTTTSVPETTTSVPETTTTVPETTTTTVPKGKPTK